MFQRLHRRMLLKYPMSPLKSVFIFLFFACYLSATTLTGNLKAPDGTGANGRLAMSLSQQGALESTGGCGGPAEIVPTYQVFITVVNGVMQSPPTIYGNDCLLPAGTWYNVTFTDTNGNTIFVDRWLITGGSIDIGTIVSVIVSGTTATLGGAAVLTAPAGNQTVVQPGSTILGVNNLTVSGTFIAPGSQCSNGGCLFSGAVGMQAGFGNALGSNAVIYVGNGNFYNRTFTGGDATCTGVLDGWTAVRSDTQEIQLCLGSQTYHIGAGTGANELSISGTVVVNSSRNLLNINSASISGTTTLNGGLVLVGSSNNSINIGALGNFYNRTFTGSDANCTGIADGWAGIRADTQTIEFCIGGTEYGISPGGGGGGGSAAGPTNAVQFKTGAGGFGGSINMTYDATTQQFAVNGTGSTDAGITLSNAYMLSDYGYAVNPSLGMQFNSIQSTNGGVTAKSIRATNYIGFGSSSGVPSLTSGDTHVAGDAYWDTSLPALEIYNGTSWASISPGTGSPGGGITGGCGSVQYVAAGPIFGGSGGFCYNPVSQLLQVAGISATAGIDETGGFIQSEQGYYSPYTSAATLNIPSGGANIGLAVQLAPLASAPGTPGSGFGGLAYKTGPNYWYWNGSAYATVDLSASGGAGANTALSNLTTTAINQHLVPATSGGFNLGQSSGNTWVNAYIEGVFQSTASGTNYTIYTGPSGTFRVNGAGAVSAVGVIASTGASGGFNVLADTSQASIQTVGGMQAAQGYWVSSTKQIIAASGAINVGTTNGVSARAFNPYTSGGVQDTGLDGTLGFNGTKLTWNGTAINGAVFVGGVIVGTN